MHIGRFSFLIVSLASPILAQTVNFNSPRTYSAVAVSTYTADFNGDGKPDLVALGESLLSVFLGNGDGTFQALPRVGLGDWLPDAFCLAVGDFNGDGKPDLAVAGKNDSGSSIVYIMLGNGDGTFQTPHGFAVGADPYFIAVADLNGDGKLDLAVADSSADSISILLGNGDGTFQDPAYYAVSEQPVSVAVGDFNGDGKPDLAVANYLTNNVSILLGNGDGTFQAGVTYAAERSPTSVAAGDFNGDGKLDLAVANFGSDTVSVLLGNGDGTFQPQVAYGVGDLPQVVAVADLNGDGIPDLAVAGYVGSSPFNSLLIRLGNGDGTFKAAVKYEPGGTSLAVADFNADGRPDIAVGRGADNNNIAILLGTGGGEFAQPVDDGVSISPDYVVAADFNGDGKPDLVVANYGTNSVSILLGEGKGMFQPLVTYQVLKEPTGIAVGDFNGDGIPDLAIVGYSANAVYIMLGSGDGTFAHQGTFEVGTGPESVAVGDFNGDGKLDLAVGNAGVGSDASVSILLGNGDGTFQKQVAYPGPGLEGGYVAVADFNGDGILDVAASFDGGLAIMPGKGNGTFGKFEVTAPGAPYNGGSPMAVADFNGDGKPDLVTGGNVFLGGVGGTFTFSKYLGFPGQAVAGDFNGDGKLDIAQAVIEGVSIFTGNGDGTFNSPVGFLTDMTTLFGGGWSLATGDFNGDGKLDLAVTNYSSDNFTVLTNTTP